MINNVKGLNVLKTSMLESDLLLLGAGKMGGALLNGWLGNGLDPKNINVVDPKPSEWLVSLANTGLNVNLPLSRSPGICIIAVKPQMVEEVLSKNFLYYKASTLFVSIVAGIKLEKLRELLGEKVAIARVMPNTPATIQKGVSCIIANEHVDENKMKLVEILFSAVGETIRLENETQMDAVTAISGSGPAYIFYLIEVLANTGIELGLDKKLSYRLALLTVSGAGVLAETSKESVNQLRSNVTSPNGTTEAALNVLMNSKKGLLPLMREAVKAARARSEKLGSQ